MRILADDLDRPLDRVTLLLTREEAKELLDSLKPLIMDPSQHHNHVSDSDFKKEVTIAVYTPDNLKQFDARSLRLIESDT